MQRYNPKDIEQKWQKQWELDGTYSVDFDSQKPKFVGFGMFNYPSGAGIHVGHVRNFTIPDVITRAKRQQGYEVYQPVGWDSFGMPAENFAIKTGVSPQESTKTAIAKYHDQYRAMGWAMDWQKEINTTDPEYYKWTQWVFTKLFEKGLAYQQESAQWWCDQCKTVLADEQVIAGKCWRHDGADDPFVTKRSLKQWFFKITEYADQMLEATDDLDWTPSVKASQKSWIGKSEGAEIDFAVAERENVKIKVFTTRPDTLFGATFMVLAPEHELVTQITMPEQKAAIDEYVAISLRKSEIERQQTDDKDKSGVFTGAYAINPANNAQIPIWIADYVLTGYGTGAIMAVPAHDDRDNAFAQKFDLPIVRVVQNDAPDEECSHDEGTMINSGMYNDMVSSDAREKIIADLAKNETAKEVTNFKMRDWLISRQRYWGAPIPVVHCAKDGVVAVPEQDLPVILPEIKDYQPTGDNVSALAGVSDWVNTTCPKCGGPAKRETDTMDGYVCSSWYFFRYLDPTNNKEAWSLDRAKHWMPIDVYNGGDHATAHLLYARFITRFFYDLGLSPVQEPFKKMIYNGKVRAADGSAFSKSKGNGIDPLEVIEQGYGADAIRLYEMFAAPVELNVLWDPQGIPGSYRFLNRIWNLTQEYTAAEAGETSAEAQAATNRAIHAAIKKVSEDIAGDRFNTAIASMMEALNGLYKAKDQYGLHQSATWQFAIEAMVQLVAPFAPHIAEELWHQLGHADTVHVDHWPLHDEKYLLTDTITIVVQVNGKVRAQLELPADVSEEQAIAAATASERVTASLDGRPIKKSIYVPKKLINLVV